MAEMKHTAVCPTFSRWIDILTEDVIQNDYGYEPGEFTVYAEEWKPLWSEGLTPQQAFRRALDAFAEVRREEDAAQKANWEHIRKADSAISKATSHNLKDGRE